MHKYQPRIHLVKRPDSGNNDPIEDLEREPHKTFIFPEAIFTAVTAYQNQLVSPLFFLSFFRFLSFAASKSYRISLLQFRISFWLLFLSFFSYIPLLRLYRLISSFGYFFFQNILFRKLLFFQETYCEYI